MGDSSRGVSELAQNAVFERSARGGYVMNGLLHLIIGYLAIRIALGSGRGDADPSGALAAVASQQGGRLALWIAATAFASMASWRLVETVLGRSTDPKNQGALAETSDRVKALGLAGVYFAFAYSAVGFARGTGESSARQNATMSARLLQSSAGVVALIVAGVIVVVVGGYHVHKGVTKNFRADLKGRSSGLAIRLGVVGYVAKGLTIAVAGVLVIVAASRSQPEKATGLDGALKVLGAQPHGVVLLILAGAGIVTYGLYSFVMARDTKM